MVIICYVYVELRIRAFNFIDIGRMLYGTLGANLSLNPTYLITDGFGFNTTDCHHGQVLLL